SGIILCLELFPASGLQIEESLIPLFFVLLPSILLLLGFILNEARYGTFAVTYSRDPCVNRVQNNLSLSILFLPDNLCLFIQLSGHNLGLASDLVDDKLDVLCNFSTYIAQSNLHT